MYSLVLVFILLKLQYNEFEQIFFAVLIRVYATTNINRCISFEWYDFLFVNGSDGISVVNY